MQLGLRVAAVALVSVLGAHAGAQSLQSPSVSTAGARSTGATTAGSMNATSSVARTAPRVSEAAFERVLIKTKDGQTIVGSFYPPKAKQGAPGALLVHSAGGERSEMVALAERLQKLGFGALAIDLRGHGESATDDSRWAKQDEKARETQWAFAVRDVDASVAWLLGQPSIHSANLSLIGYRSGATLVARHAKSDENVRSLTLLSPPSSGVELGFNLVKDLEELAGLPIYMAFSKDEPSTSKMLGNPDKKSGDLEFLQIAIFKCPGTELLEDKKLSADVTKWIQERASPRKGSR